MISQNGAWAERAGRAMDYELWIERIVARMSTIYADETAIHLQCALPVFGVDSTMFCDGLERLGQH